MAGAISAGLGDVDASGQRTATPSIDNWKDPRGSSFLLRSINVTVGTAVRSHVGEDGVERAHPVMVVLRIGGTPRRFIGGVDVRMVKSTTLGSLGTKVVDSLVDLVMVRWVFHPG